jgi:hypothetical protein
MEGVFAEAGVLADEGVLFVGIFTESEGFCLGDPSATYLTAGAAFERDPATLGVTLGATLAIAPPKART